MAIKNFDFEISNLYFKVKLRNIVNMGLTIFVCLFLILIYNHYEFVLMGYIYSHVFNHVALKLISILCKNIQYYLTGT